MASHTTMECWVGTSGFHYDHWRGFFYPQELPKARWLEFYAQRFSTLELNSPFYRLPSEAAFDGWERRTPPGFRFAIKASRFITHVKRLRDAEEPLRTFLDRSRRLKAKLGPVLYQLPPSMQRDDELLEVFLRQLPADVSHAVEFRHPSWYHDAVYRMLRRHNVALCVHDMARLQTPLVATADFLYIRFHGVSGLYAGSYTDRQLLHWTRQIQDLAAGCSGAYVYFNNDIGGHAVSNARTLMEMLC